MLKLFSPKIFPPPRIFTPSSFLCYLSIYTLPIFFFFLIFSHSLTFHTFLILFFYFILCILVSRRKRLKCSYEFSILKIVNMYEI